MVFSLAAILALSGGALAANDEAPTDTDNWLEVTYALAISEDLRTLLLDGEVGIHLVERPSMGNPWVNAALQDECGQRCSADDLRRIYQAHESQQDALVEHLEDQIEDKTRSLLQGITKSPADVNATADREALQEAPRDSPYHSPIPVDLTGTSNFTFLDDADIDRDQAEALFKMGARTPIPLESPVDPGTNLTVTLEMRPPLAVLDADQGTNQDDVTQWRITNWNNTDPATLEDEATLGRPDVTVPNDERVDIDVTLDLSNIEVHYIDALTGGTPATLNAEINLQTAVHALEVPPEFDTDRLELDVLSADALRIALDADLLEESQLTQFEDDARQALQQAFESLAGETVPVSGGFLTDTLTEDALGTPLGSGQPLTLNLDAAHPIAFPPDGDALEGAAGFEVTRIDHGTLELPEIPTPGDRPANVTLVLPPGIDLAFDSVESGEATRSQTEDGLTAVTFTTGGDEGPTTVQGTEFVVNSPFLWNILWQAFLLLFLVLVVLPGIVIFLVIRRRRQSMDRREAPTGRVAGGYKAGDSDPSTPSTNTPTEGKDSQQP